MIRFLQRYQDQKKIIVQSKLKIKKSNFFGNDMLNEENNTVLKTVIKIHQSKIYIKHKYQSFKHFNL